METLNLSNTQELSQGGLKTSELDNFITPEEGKLLPPADDVANLKILQNASPSDLYDQHIKNNILVEAGAEELKIEQEAAAALAAYKEEQAKEAPAEGAPAEAPQATPENDIEIPTIPGMEISPERLALEQRNRDLIKVEQDYEDGNKPLPTQAVEGLYTFGNELAKVPGTAFDILMQTIRPLGAFGSFGLAPIANPSTTGDTLADLKADFVTGYEAAKADLLGEGDAKSYGTAIAIQRLGLEGVPAAVVGGTIDILGDPTVAASAGSFAIIRKGLALKEANAIATGNPGSSSDILTNGLYEILTFGKEPINIEKTSRVMELAKTADSTGSKKDVKALYDAIDEVPEIDAAVKASQDADAAADIARFQTKLGDPAGPKFTEESASLSDDDMLGTILSPDEFVPGTINTSTINSVEDADQTIFDLLEFHEANFDKRVNPSALDAHDIGQSQMLAETLGAEKVVPMPGRTAYAYRQTLLASSQNLHKLAKATKQTDSSNLDVLAFQRALSVHRRIAEKATGQNLDAGRLYEMYEPKGLQGKDLVDEITFGASAAKRNEQMQNLLREILSMEGDPTIASKVASKSLGTNISDSLFELYANALLAGIQTTGVNIASNTALLFWKPTENALEGMSAAAFGDFNRAQLKAKEAGVRMAGIAQGFSDAMRLALRNKTWDDLRLDGTHFASGEIARMRVRPAITAENYGASGVFGRSVDIAGRGIRFPGWFLQKQDVAMKLMHYRADINASAMLKSADTGIAPSQQSALYNTLRHNPTKEMENRAIFEGEYNTFTNDLGEMGEAFQTLAKSPKGRFFFPFFHTPLNIVKMGVRRGPLGNIFGNTKEMDMANTWNSAKTRAFGELQTMMNDGGAAGDTARARLAMGTMIPMTIVATLGEDNITGQIDMKSELGRFKNSQDKPAYSVRFGDKWYSYEKIEPLRSILGFHVNLREVIAAAEMRNEDNTPTELGAEITSTAILPVLQTMKDSTFIPQIGGILGMIDALSRTPERAGSDEYSYGQFAEKQFSKILVGATPFSSFGRQMNTQYLDKQYRMANTYLEQLMKVIPGMSERLPAKRNIWGVPQFYESGVGPDLISPIKTAAVKYDRTDKHLVKLKVNIPGIPKQMIVSGIELKLNTDQQARFQLLRAFGADGQTSLKQVIDGIVSQRSFRKLAPEIQKAKLELVFAKFTRKAKDELYEEDQEGGPNSLKSQFSEKMTRKIQRYKQGSNPDIGAGQ